MKPEISYIDEFNKKHYITEPLGAGGYGKVYRTKDARIAIKLRFSPGGADTDDFEDRPKQIAKFKDELNFVRTLALGGSISVPIAALQGGICGLTMELFQDMNSADSITPKYIKDITICKAFAHFGEEELPERLKRWLTSYIDSGGLRRRLLFLANAAALLTGIHGRGLVFGDVSLNNIFCSSDLNYYRCGFIDADNIRYDEPSLTGRGSYTPEFASPELMGIHKAQIGAKPNDCHAFAVVAFKVLTGVHPFDGDALADNYDFLEGNYEPAGRDAYILDEDDTSNQSTDISMLVIDNIIFDSVKTLFDETFIKGCKIPALRPPIYFWRNAFLSAADITVRCDVCGFTYHYNNDTCVICDAPRPKIIIAQSGGGIFAREFQKSVNIPLRLFGSNLVGSEDEYCMEITQTRNTELKLSSKGYEIVRVENGKALPAKRNIVVPIEDLGKFEFGLIGFNARLKLSIEGESL